MQIGQLQDAIKTSYEEEVAAKHEELFEANMRFAVKDQELFKANGRITSMAREIEALRHELLEACNRKMRVETQVDEARDEYATAKKEVDELGECLSRKRSVRLDVDRFVEELDGYGDRCECNIMCAIHVVTRSLDLRGVNLRCY
ncbi:hypothetical protein V6N12_068652 [Hibiscus sabdariffa]|uniref:Uncharacterized protein n=1 Tax=Hibiscus sabdariffa TaxID=183260 RepID=A0ABR2FQS5_9ROSI